MGYSSPLSLSPSLLPPSRPLSLPPSLPHRSEMSSSPPPQWEQDTEIVYIVTGNVAGGVGDALVEHFFGADKGGKLTVEMFGEFHRLNC